MGSSAGSLRDHRYGEHPPQQHDGSPRDNGEQEAWQNDDTSGDDDGPLMFEPEEELDDAHAKAEMQLQLYGSLDWKNLLPGSAPLDEEGYVVSFDVGEEEELLTFFEKFGFVVLRNILSDDQVEATLDEFFAGEAGHFPRESGMEVRPIDRTNADGWASYWDSETFGHLGIIGEGPDLAPVQLSNRVHPRVYHAWRAVLQSNELYVDHDRMGVMRPTKSVPFSTGPRDMPEWSTPFNWLHLDCNPSVGRASIAGFVDDGSRIDFNKTLIPQGLLTLTDAPVECGGFHCVPGSHKYSQAWVQQSPFYGVEDSSIQVSPNDPLMKHVQKIPIRKGCQLVWSSLLFHANHPNQSNRFRAVQYIRAMPITGTPYSPLFRAYHQARYFPEEWKADALGRKLLGWEPW